MRSNQRQFADVEWLSGGIPKSSRYDDPYFSKENGLAETRHVFLKGNDLPKRFNQNFQVAELGFGTGLNLLATWQLWRDTNQSGRLCFTSFEMSPMHIADMEKALSQFPSLADLSAALLKALKHSGPILTFDDLKLEIIYGDANQALPAWSNRADAWFLDGFSPAKNPELWNSELLHAVATHTNPHGTFATYTSAGHVRRGLNDAGFTTKRIAGYGRKRHMSIGTLGEFT